MTGQTQGLPCTGGNRGLSVGDGFWYDRHVLSKHGMVFVGVKRNGRYEKSEKS